MTTREKLLAIAEEVATNPDIELVYQEADDSTKENIDAAHFLKYKGKRIGRDIELYAFLSEISTDLEMWCDFLAEVIFPLNLHNSKAAKSIMAIGFKLLDEEHWNEWRDLFIPDEVA